MATTNDLQAARDALNAARVTAQGLQQNLNVSSAQLTAAATAIAAATASITTVTQALNNDPSLVEARAAATARAALGPAIAGAVALLKTTDQAISQFRAEGVR